MHQNPTFNLRLQQLKEGNPTGKKPLQRNSFHDALSAAKKLCIVWENGRKMIFYYSYLIAIDLQLQDVPNTMTLQFMAHSVTLKGYNLDSLFTKFLLDEPHIVHVTSERYASIIGTNNFLVTDAIVEK